MLTKKTISLLLISLVAFIDLMGVGLVYPMFASMLYRPECLMLPEGTSEAVRGACLGVLLATMPLTQFFSAPFLGMLSDQKGRKKVLIPSLFIGVLGYLMAVAAVSYENLFLLLLSRVFVGISAGTASVVSASLADISTPENKAKNFGILNMAFGLGFTIGPFLGGVLSETSFYFLSGYALPFAMACLITSINLVLIYYFYEETFVPKCSEKLSFSLGIVNIKKALQSKNLQTVFLSVFLACVGWSFYWEFNPVTWITQYGFSTSTIGNFYAYGAAFYAVCCGILIRPIVGYFKSKNVLCFALIASAVTIGMLLVQTDEIWLYLFIPLQQFSISLFWPTSAAVVSNAVSEDMQGETLGVLHSVDSLAFAISPLFAGPLLGLSSSMPIIVGSVAMLMAAAVLAPTLRKEYIETNDGQKITIST
jgi:DHA1 family tetracycline resistance protein-like MFS transporter